MTLPKQLTDHAFAAFIAGAIALACTLVMVSMVIYYVSGASRLDLSRPEYTSMRARIDQGRALDEGFPAQGSVTKETIDEFMKSYNHEAAKSTKAPVFSTDALSDTSLGITPSASSRQ